MSKICKSQWMQNIDQIGAIGKEIAKLSAESKKLRLLVGDNAEHVGFHIPTRDHPLEVSLITKDTGTRDTGEACVVITITPAVDPKNKDWNVTFRAIPRI